MKRYAITARSTFDYAQPVASGQHLIRMLPNDSHGQSLQFYKLDVEPHPTGSHSATDFFGNHVLAVLLSTPHPHVQVEMEAEVSVYRPLSLWPPNWTWEAVAERAQASSSLAPTSPAHFLRQTPYTQADGAITAFAHRFFGPGTPIGDGAAQLALAIMTECDYRSGSTSVNTNAMQAFAGKQGVCQDFAHIMIAALRVLGIPARYVSGYLRTQPPPGQPKLQGADAMHAWVSVWTGPEAEWVDYDPTNGCAVQEDYIVAAIGRDYSDVPPMLGEVLGGGEQSDKIAVDVVELR